MINRGTWSLWHLRRLRLGTLGYSTKAVQAVGHTEFMRAEPLGLAFI